MKNNSALDRGRRLRTYGLLHAILFIYALGAVCSKMASGQDFLSPPFLAWYGLLLLTMLIYAFFWQRVLKTLPLTVAYANKGITIVWGVLWGALLFAEQLRWTMLPGIALIVTGICLVVANDAE